jgi:hypothetical protein
MSESPISDAIALRIALAARTLPDMGAARLIRIIEDAIGLPPTAKKLGGLKVKDLKTALGGELADVDTDALKAAVAILKGEATADAAPPPPVEPYTEEDMPDSIRVACASDNRRFCGDFPAISLLGRCSSELFVVRPDFCVRYAL